MKKLPEEQPEKEPEGKAEEIPQPLAIPAVAALQIRIENKAIERFLTSSEVPKTEKDRYHAERLINGLHWQASLLLWNDYKEQGEEVVFERLPGLLLWDFEFYIRQWWVAQLLGAWHREGRQEDINCALFGSLKNKQGEHKRGVRSFPRTMQHYNRDTKIYVEVEKLMQAGLTERKACTKVSKEIQNQPVWGKERFSWDRIKDIHNEVARQLPKRPEAPPVYEWWEEDLFNLIEKLIGEGGHSKKRAYQKVEQDIRAAAPFLAAQGAVCHLPSIREIQTIHEKIKKNPPRRTPQFTNEKGERIPPPTAEGSPFKALFSRSSR